MSNNSEIEIKSKDHWVKVIEMLQQNWALIDPEGEGGGVVVYFVDDLSRVFDRLRFDSVQKAEAGLMRNGFSRFSEDPQLNEFLYPPMAPYEARRERPIYSSGQYWH